MKEIKSDMIWGLIWLCIGVLVLAISAPYAKAHSLDPVGPAYLPRLLGCGLAILGLGMFLEAYSKYRQIPAEQRAADKAEPEFAPGGALRIVWTTVVAIVYLVLMEPLGFIIVTPIFVAAVMLIYGDKDKKRILWMSLGSTAILYAVFAIGLKVLLPMGPLANLF